jgi:hypothetical protein
MSRNKHEPPEGYGEAVRAVIAPAACGGFVLLAEFTRAGLRSVGADLGIRWDDYDTPDPAEIAAADAELTRLSLTRTAAWRPGSEPGSLTAPVTRNRSSAHPNAQARTRIRATLVRLFSRKEVTR